MNELLSKMPSEFLRKIKNLYPDNYEQIFETFLNKKKTTFRINYLKTDLVTLRKDLSRNKIRFNELDYPKGGFISKTPLKHIQNVNLYLNGHIYIQNISSMIPAIVLSPEKGQRILDLCAAPGTKTTQIVSLCPEAELYAIEKVRVRFYKLLNNIKIQGAGNYVKAALMDGTLIRRKYPEYFDKILLDAPCSTEGRFLASNPLTFKYWKDKKVKEMVRTQKKLLYSAFFALKEQGELIYSTCTFSPEENEEILDWYLDKFNGKIEMVDIKIPLENSVCGIRRWHNRKYSSQVRLARRILPNDYMEGFFIAKLRKVSD
ncbi:MAG: RsmB/NOP family class I SAM-dependent RNA methyltransferase [Candidatus Omnitrophota bacterium]